MLVPYKESSTCRNQRSGNKRPAKICSVSKAMGGAQLLEKCTNDQFTIEKHGLVYL